MTVGDAFDEWAAAGRDRGMEDRHWRTAREALAMMPIEDGDIVCDLGPGSGYAARAMYRRGAGRAIGVDRSREMVANARSYTDEARVGFLRGEFQSLPFPTDAVDHVFTMEAIYYADDPRAALAEIARVLRPGGTIYCCVDFYAENEYSHGWTETTGLAMTLWDRGEYREAFRDAGLAVAAQRNIPDREIEIPPADAFPLEGGESTTFATREEMVERYRELGTLLTVGVSQ